HPAYRDRAMATPDHPAPSAAPDPSTPPLTSVSPGPGVQETTPGPLAPPQESVPPPARPSRAFGPILTGFVLLFAFLVSASAVRNSDFWLHLAAGRLLAQGDYHFGVDPFAYTSADVYWVNHAWLFDRGLYAAYQALGGPGLVVLKALAVTALAWLLLR